MIKFLYLFVALFIMISANIYSQCCTDEMACNFDINCTEDDLSQIDLTSWQSGMYIVVFNTANGPSQTEKLILKTH